MADKNLATVNVAFPIYVDVDGVKTPFHDIVLRKSTADSIVMSLGDKITGDFYYKDNKLVFSMQEYIEYKGVKYFLVNPPTVVREGIASENSGMNGMTKYSVEFYHPMAMLANFPFTDVAVNNDQEKYLSQNKTFSWIGKPQDFIDKLNKNLQGTQWVVAKSSRFPVEKDDELSDVLSFDNSTIADAVKVGYDTWSIPYVVSQISDGEPYYDQGKRFLIEYGLPSNEIYASESDRQLDKPFVFKFGQGVGLKNNSRTPRNNKIVTRIAGYGSENNIPYGYPQIQWYGDLSWDYTINNDPNAVGSYPIYKGIVGGKYVKLIKHPFTRTKLMPSVYSETVFNKVSPYAKREIHATPNYNDTLTAYLKHIDVYIADASGNEKLALQKLKEVLVEVGTATVETSRDISTSYCNGSVYMDEELLMRGFVTVIGGGSREYEFEQVYNDTHDDPVAPNADYSPNAEIKDYYDAEYSEEYPYVNEINLQAPSYDIHEFEDIKPELDADRNISIIDAVPLNADLTPADKWDDSMDDDGNYLQSYFKITLPQLSFDLYACAAITQEMQINMRSGACIGCTFTVQVDWDDYKKVFYDDKGNFVPDGAKRQNALDRYPYSNKGQIDVVVQKDNNTFGTLMPNIYQQPKANDLFVILGISLPLEYITNAEQRLDVAMKTYMLENNIYYFDYPLKFDEYFLTKHENILSQIRPNSIIRFEYGNEELELFVKQMTVKYGESVLPKYDITLTDNVEVVLNSIGKVADDVEHLSSLISILRQTYNRNVWYELSKKLSKTQDDTAQGFIRFIKGLQVGSDFTSGILGGGGVFRVNDDGTVYIEADKLYVRMKAYFDSVEVKDYKHTSGNRISSKAGMKCSRVEWIDAEGKVVNVLADAVKFRCYFRASDGEDTIKNDFVVGDLAFCDKTTLEDGINQRRYWRAVVEKNSVLTDDGEAWIDLSVSDCEQNSDVPMAQDDIVQLGNKTDAERQGAIVEYVGGEDAPSYQIYQGINTYSLADKNYVNLGYSSSTNRAYMRVYGDMYIGDKPDSQGNKNSYIQYDSANKILNIKAAIDIQSSVGDNSLKNIIGSLQKAADDAESHAGKFDYIKEALQQDTLIQGGLVLSSLIGLRDSNGDVQSGINGAISNELKGGGIAAWYGGEMIDYETLTDQEKDTKRWAKSVQRFDGSGYLASGNITWDKDGRIAIKDITTIIGENNTDVLNELTKFNNAFHFNTQQGTTTILSITPQVGFTSLSIIDGNDARPVATQKWVNDNYVSISFFERMFQAYNGTTKVAVNSNSTIDNIKAMFGFWTEQYLSALGQNSSGGSGSGGGGGGQGVDMTEVWAAFETSGSEQIHISHLNAIKTWTEEQFAPLSHVRDGELHITSNERDRWTSAASWVEGISQSGDTDDIINKWKEVVAFLDKYTEDETLEHLLSGYVTIDTTQTITGAKTFSSTITPNGGLVPMAIGNVNSQTAGSKLVLKQADVNADKTPNNGLVFEFGSFSGWSGQLYMADNGQQGLYWSGWWEGVHQDWVKLAFVTDTVAAANKISVARTLWGQSFDGTANVSGNMSGVGTLTASGLITANGNIKTSSYIEIGNYRIVAETGGLKVMHKNDSSNNVTPAYLYATGAVSALGLNSASGSGSSGESGVDMTAVWSALADSTNEQISNSHLTALQDLYAPLVGYTNHINNTNIHITPQERTLWNSKADGSFVMNMADVMEGILNDITDLEGDTVILKGYFSSTGTANQAARLNTSGTRSIWGQKYWDSGKPVDNNITGNMTGVGSISMSGSISGATTISASSNVTVGNDLTVTRYLVSKTAIRMENSTSLDVFDSNNKNINVLTMTSQNKLLVGWRSRIGGYPTVIHGKVVKFRVGEGLGTWGKTDVDDIGDNDTIRTGGITGDGIMAMIIDADGNVGIGGYPTVSDYKLYVRGALRVSENISASSIVTTNGGATIGGKLEVASVANFSQNINVTGRVNANSGMRIGNYMIVEDTDGGGLKVVGVNSNTAANFWATGAISALGYNGASGGGGGGGDATTVQAIINEYLKVKVGSAEYYPVEGTVSLPDYPTTLPASDVYAWAKASRKPSYGFSEITGTVADSQLSEIAVSKVSGLQALLDAKATITALNSATSRIGTLEGYFTDGVAKSAKVAALAVKANEATIAESATTAEKLASPIRLWGQSFDGASDIDGAMSVSGNILPSETSTYQLGSSTNRWNVIAGVNGNFSGTLTVAENIYTSKNILPQTTGSGQLGSSSNRWGNVVTKNINSTGTATLAKITASGSVTLSSTLTVSDNTTIGGLLTANGNIKAASHVQIGDYVIEAVANTGLKVRHATSSTTAAHLWATGAVSSLGLNSSGGSSGGGGGDTDMTTVWSALQENTSEQINTSHLTTALSPYTKTSDFNALIIKADGTQLASYSPTNNTTVNFVSGNGIALSKETGALTIGLTSGVCTAGTYTKVSVDTYGRVTNGATLSASDIPSLTKSKISDFPTSMPASDVYAWAKAATKPTYTASEVGLGNVGNFKAVSTVASQGLTDTEKSNARTNIGVGTIATKDALLASDIPTLSISKIDGLQSALNEKALASDVSTLQGYFSNGVANSSARLSVTNTYTAWGQTYWQNGVPSGNISGAISEATTISASGLITANGGVTVPSNKTVKIGEIEIEYDATNNAIRIKGGGLYADTFISAKGVSSNGTNA